MNYKQIAFILVGHSNWGKSQTLKLLTDNNPYIRYWEINGKKFFIRRMSNDDEAEGLLNFVRKLNPTKKPLLVLTLCPDFTNYKKRTLDILNVLHQNYRLFIYVLKYPSNPKRQSAKISDEEIEQIRSHGETLVWPDLVDAETHKVEFARFISENLDSVLE